MDEPKSVTAYTRGIATPGGGAYGALLTCDGRSKELSGGEATASNNRMDLLAAVEALRSLKWPCRVTLYNTNGYLIEGMSKGWASRWRDAGWVTGEGKPTAHADLWAALLDLSAVHQVEFVWLPADGVAEYDRCYELARAVVEGQVRRVAGGRAVKAVGMRVSVSVGGRVVSFDSPYTDDEAVAVLRGLMGRGRVLSSFADDLLREVEGGQRLSRGQLNWVHKLVADAERRGRERTAGEITGQTRKPGSHKWSHPGT